MTNKTSPRIIGAICLSCIFFLCSFTSAIYLSKHGYLKNESVKWKVSITTDSSEIILANKAIASVTVNIENLGTETLESTLDTGSIFVSFHVLTVDGKSFKHDNDWFAIPEPLRKNQQKPVVIVLDNNKLDLKPGEYVIEFDLVKEGGFWFAEKGGTALKIPMAVIGETE